jgi:hypothetical protein
LQQRNFTNIGLDNYTFHIGQRFDSTLPFALGWSFLAFHVDLSKEHIQNPAQVYCIEGDRSVLSGDTAEVDLWFDGSFNLLSFVKIGNCYLFRIVPEMGLGIGYGMWGFFNEKNKQSYKLEVMMLSTRINLRTSIFDLFYIDYPLWNFCIFLLKNRPAYGDLGDVKITRPETFGLRALMAVGITIKL